MKNKEAKSIFSSLENYSSIPPPELWDNIEAQLEQPKKKKRAIIWWSVAASLVIGLSVPTIFYLNSNQVNGLELNIENNANGVVLQKDSNEKKNSTSNENSDQNGNDNHSDIGIRNASLNSNQIATADILNVSSKVNDSSKSENFNQKRSNGMIPTAKKEASSIAVASNQNATSFTPKSEVPINKSAQVTNSNSNKYGVVNNQTNDISEENKDNGVAENSISKAVIDKTVQAKHSLATEQSIATNENDSVSGLTSNNKISESTVTKDSLGKIKSEVEQLEKVLVEVDKDKTKKKTVSESIDKWSVQVFAGVMSSQNFNNEKTLGSTVDSKQSSGYGVKTNYKLNKKWGLSTGFKINELGQKIAGVSYYERQSYSGMDVNNLPIGNNLPPMYSPSPYLNDFEIVSISNNQAYLFTSNSNASANGFEKGNVTQNLKYFEMPLEVSYSLLSRKKTNISMNTGGFVGKLIENDLLLNGNSIGENKNVSEFVYGTLLSSTVQYELFKQTNFFIEPGMNYYINPLENQSFNQFQWMFNFGLNVSF